MTNIKITFDKETGYYDGLIISKGIATQAQSLDELIKNLGESITLSQKKEFSLDNFSISFDENYVNI